MFPLSLQGLECLWLKIIRLPEWPILGHPALGPYTFLTSLPLGFPVTALLTFWMKSSFVVGGPSYAIELNYTSQKIY